MHNIERSSIESISSSRNRIHVLTGSKSFSLRARAKSRSNRFQSGQGAKRVKSNPEGRQLDGKDSSAQVGELLTNLGRGLQVLYLLDDLYMSTFSRDRYDETPTNSRKGILILHSEKPGTLLFMQSSLSSEPSHYPKNTIKGHNETCKECHVYLC